LSKIKEFFSVKIPPQAHDYSPIGTYWLQS